MWGVRVPVSRPQDEELSLCLGVGTFFEAPHCRV